MEDNEMVVAYLLERTDAQLVPIKKDQAHFLDGVTTRGRKVLPDVLRGSLRILPQGSWDGFYVAKMEKPRE